MYCKVCGKEVLDEAVVCTACGCAIEKQKDKTDSNSKLSLCLGIVGIVCAWIFALVGHISSIAGIVVGLKDYKQKGYSVGLGLSIIGEACSLLSSFIGIISVASIL